MRPQALPGGQRGYDANWGGSVREFGQGEPSLAISDAVRDLVVCVYDVGQVWFVRPGSPPAGREVDNILPELMCRAHQIVEGHSQLMEGLQDDRRRAVKMKRGERVVCEGSDLIGGDVNGYTAVGRGSGISEQSTQQGIRLRPIRHMHRHAEQEEQACHWGACKASKLSELNSGRKTICVSDPSAVRIKSGLTNHICLH